MTKRSLVPNNTLKIQPFKIEISKNIDLNTCKIKFLYSGSDPDAVVKSGAGTPKDPYVYTLPTEGHLRIWKKDGTLSRNTSEVSEQDGDRVKNDTQYDPSVFDFGVDRIITLYVEGIKKSETDR